MKTQKDPPVRELKQLLKDQSARITQLEREIAIEAALERVRARTMAMHHSDELPETAGLLFEQLKALGFQPWACAFTVFRNGTEVADAWGSTQTGIMPAFTHPHNEDPASKNIYKAWQSGEALYVQEIKGKALAKHFQFMLSLTELKEMPQKLESMDIDLPTYMVMHAANFKQGYLIFNTLEPQPGYWNIFKRFAKVFEQTYTRFLDLQKAEAQAREAQIQVALEKVRARAMGMHHSDELKELIGMVFTELTQLDLVLTRSLIWIIDPDTHSARWWMANSEEPTNPASFFIQYNEHPPYLAFIEGWKERNVRWEYSLEGEVKKDFDDFLFVDTELFRLPAFVIEGMRAPDRVILSASFNNFGCLQVAGLEALSDEHFDILLRFARVFELSYTRFNDLKQAEAQAKEAKIEAALERVRSRTMAMHNSDELREVVALLYEQLNSLELAKHGCEIILCDEDKDQLQYWSANIMQAHLPERYDMSRFSHPLFQKQWTAWKQQQESLIIPLEGQEKRDFDEFILNETHFQKFPDHVKEFIRSQKTEVFTHAIMKFGLLEAVDNEVLSEEKLEVLKRFAIVFEQTYTRFLDLQKAEEQAKLIREEKLRLEKTLQHLRDTQTQLIHAEKMASLGQLTAGIAHEIQNPLNFVNNFAQVSGELLEEMKEELQKGETAEAIDLADLLIQNLGKINHHGQRADAIVKGMLQHSRSSDSKKEPTDINALAEEYLRLAYHACLAGGQGLRAKDASFNLKVETEFDASIGKINVSPQEMGRVLLNLITNAFQTCIEHDQKEAVDYEPLISVITKNGEDMIKLIVKDNGKGIPKAIQDKIFQPFFTTKPTGQGTGLGLSLAYDIVKAHQGELRVESTEGEGASFTITLPKA